MARPTIEPITSERLPEFCAFLNEHLDASRPVSAWLESFRVQWARQVPNHGFALLNEGRIVGGIGALYADRWVRGRHETFCNITSWCVLDAHRQQSMRLAMAVIAQPGLHFTDLSPTKVVGGTLQFLKFKPIDERQVVVPNLPWWAPGSPRILDRPSDIEAALSGQALRDYRAHAVFPWLRHLVMGSSDAWCHVIYKRRSYKGLPSAQILYASDRQLLQTGLRRLCSSFAARGMATTHLERRWLSTPPKLSVERHGFNAKVFLSPTLEAADIDYLYTETMALDV